MSRRASRVDANQPRIVEALRKVGCTVHCIHTVGSGCPDLLVGHRGRTYLLEIKSDRGILNAAEAWWHDTWLGQVAVVRTVDEAFKVCGVRIVGGGKGE